MRRERRRLVRSGSRCRGPRRRRHRVPALRAAGRGDVRHAEHAGALRGVRRRSRRGLRRDDALARARLVPRGARGRRVGLRLGARGSGRHRARGRRVRRSPAARRRARSPLGRTGRRIVPGRPDVADSVSARVGGIGRLLEGSASDVLLGRQLGLGTNAARQLGGARGDAEAGGGAGESGIAALVLQAGLVGLALFAAALGLAFARNTPARPLVLALALAGLVLNVPEAFPLNLLLGFVLALPRPFPLASSPLPA